MPPPACDEVLILISGVQEPDETYAPQIDGLPPERAILAWPALDKGWACVFAPPFLPTMMKLGFHNVLEHKIWLQVIVSLSRW